MKLKPLFDRVVIKPNENESKSSSGLVLPETSQERPQIGKIVAVGDGENMDNVKCVMKVKIGDTVVFNKYAGVELKLENETYIIMRQIDVIGVLNDWKNYC